MVLTLAELLRINVEISNNDLVLQRVDNQKMIRYLTEREFSHVMTHRSGLAVYEHPRVMVKDGDEEYLFSTGIDMNDDGKGTLTHAGNVQQFMSDMQRFYELRDGRRPSVLEILNDLV